MPAVPQNYADIADDLAERIARGEYPVGSQLPSYAELGEIYSVHVTTIRSAVRLLRDRGVVYGWPGKGVFVA